jgi:hypothetical protein
MVLPPARSLIMNSKFPNRLFRFKVFGCPMVIVDNTHLHEFLHAPEDQLSFNKGFIEGLSLPYLFRTNTFNNYHVRILRRNLTQNIGKSMADTVDELKAAFEDEFGSLISIGRFLLTKDLILPRFGYTRCAR